MTSKIEIYNKEDVRIEFREFIGYRRVYTKFISEDDKIEINSKVPSRFTREKMISQALGQVNNFKENNKK